MPEYHDIPEDRSVRGTITPEQKLSELRLELRNHLGDNKIWVIVEGENDIRLYRKLLDASHVKIEESGGWGKIEFLVNGFRTETKSVLGIRDADFLRFTEPGYTENDIFLTDGHDTEVMMLSSNEAVKAVFAEHYPANRDYTHKWQDNRKRLFESVKFLGGIRYLNAREKLELNFKGLGLKDTFFDNQNLSLNKEACVSEIMERSSGKTRDITVEEVEALVHDIADLDNLCCGHDVIKAFALFHTAGESRKIRFDRIESALRLSFSKAEFKKTTLYKKLEQWELQKDVSLLG